MSVAAFVLALIALGAAVWSLLRANAALIHTEHALQAVDDMAAAFAQPAPKPPPPPEAARVEAFDPIAYDGERA